MDLGSVTHTQAKYYVTRLRIGGKKGSYERHDSKADMYVQKALLQSCGVSPHSWGVGAGVHRELVLHSEARGPYTAQAKKTASCFNSDLVVT